MIKLISMILCLATMSSRAENLGSWLRSLPQVKTVTTYDVTNAGCILIHMRQVHPDPLQLWKTKAEWWPIIKGVRDDIFGVGTNLQSRFGVSSYYPEGYTADDIASVQDQVKTGRTKFEEDRIKRKWDEDERHEAETELAKLEAVTTTQTNAQQMQEMRLCKNTLLFPPMPHYGDNIMDLDDTLLLAIAANMEPRVSEDATAHKQAIEEAERVKDGKDTFGSAEWNRKIMLDREQAILKTIAADYASGAVTNHYALLICGGMHDFTESIQNWNTTNLFKFSLVTVTPKSYQ
jgi:hypothetical protein